MRNLRVSRKGARPIRKQLGINARDIILSIFSQQTDAQKLEYSKSNWKTTDAGISSNSLNLLEKTDSQPLKNLYPFLEHISNGLDVDTCSYLFVDGPILRIVSKEKKVKISKTRFNCQKLKYWLSHIYFSRFRSKLSEKLLTQPQNTSRNTINTFEEKEYMPRVLLGKSGQKSPLIRRILVSPDGRFRRSGQAQKQSFCIVYNKNGSEQQFNFSQILSFVDYPFNLKDIVYIKIIPKHQRNQIPISLRYSKVYQTKREFQILRDLRDIYQKTQGWQQLRDEFDRKKLDYLVSQNYQQYSSLSTLELIAFIQVQHRFAVKVLEISWVRSQKKGVILTNIAKYTTLPIHITNTPIGLETLYKKLRAETPRQPSRGSKRIKSEEKQMSVLDYFSLALETVEKNTKPSSRLDGDSPMTRSPIKGKSAVFRGLTSLFT